MSIAGVAERFLNGGGKGHFGGKGASSKATHACMYSYITEDHHHYHIIIILLLSISGPKYTNVSAVVPDTFQLFDLPDYLFLSDLPYYTLL